MRNSGRNIRLILLLFFATSSYGQVMKSDSGKESLKAEILKMDSLLFNIAFNQCDTLLFKKIISDSIEFYDDRTGLNTSKEVEVKSLMEKCARKEKLTRVLKSTTVTKLGDFGAVQVGEHDFALDGVVVGSAQFIHIWERTKNGWILKRIVSYEHASTGK